jgi:hypothetical protein
MYMYIYIYIYAHINHAEVFEASFEITATTMYDALCLLAQSDANLVLSLVCRLQRHLDYLQRHLAYVSIRQQTSAYVSIRQHTSAYASIRQHVERHLSLLACAGCLALGGAGAFDFLALVFRAGGGILQQQPLTIV